MIKESFDQSIEKIVSSHWGEIEYARESATKLWIKSRELLRKEKICVLNSIDPRYVQIYIMDESFLEENTQYSKEGIDLIIMRQKKTSGNKFNLLTEEFMLYPDRVMYELVDTDDHLIEEHESSKNELDGLLKCIQEAKVLTRK